MVGPGDPPKDSTELIRDFDPEAALAHLMTVLAPDVTQEVPVPCKQQRLPSTDDDQMVELARLGMALESIIGWPVDIEWAYRGRELLLLQWPSQLMKVLFVCYANVGRSQVAQAYFTKLSQHDSDSAGIAVNDLIAKGNLAGNKLKDMPTRRSVEYIGREFGVGISEKERQQLTPALIDNSDLVIVIAEKERWPGYLKEGGKVVFWDVPDAVGRADDFAYDVYRQVQRHVEELVEEIG